MKFLIMTRLPQIYSSQRLVQEVRARGHHVQTENPENPWPSPDSGPWVVIPRLGSFRYPQAMAQLQAMELLHPSVRVLNSSSSFHRACNKKSTHLALGNLPQPELYDKATRFPMVVKDCHSSKGEAVFLCHTHDELRACLLKLQDREILFQEYIAESAGRDVRAFVIGQKSVACIERQAKPDSGEFRANLSLGGTAFKTSLSSAEEEMCIEAVRRVGLDYAGVDFVRATRGSLLLEINPCPGLEGVEKCTGVNVAKELVLYAEGLLTARPER